MSEYIKPDGTSYSDWECEVIDCYRDDLVSGAVFHRHVASAASVYGYQPPVHRGSWSHAMATIGRMAGSSDALAQVAAAVFGHVNLYATSSEVAAQIWRAVAAALDSGFDDVLGRTGPEAGRHSQYQRDFNLSERLYVLAWITEATSKLGGGGRVGWCADALIRANHVHTHRITSS